MNYKFYREEGRRWYIDLPEYIEAGGFKGSLAMVAGADTFLDILLEDDPSNEVILQLELDKQNNPEFNILSKDDRGKIRKFVLGVTFGGADYTLIEYKGETINHKMWLCDVTKYVFGYFPDEIYFKKVK